MTILNSNTKISFNYSIFKEKIVCYKRILNIFKILFNGI